MFSRSLLLLFLFFSSALSQNSTEAEKSDETEVTTESPFGINCWTAYRRNVEEKTEKEEEMKERFCLDTDSCLLKTLHGRIEEGKKGFMARADCGKKKCEEGCKKIEAKDYEGEVCCCKGDLCHDKEKVEKWIKEKTSNGIVYTIIVILPSLFYFL